MNKLLSKANWSTLLIAIIGGVILFMVERQTIKSERSTEKMTAAVNQIALNRDNIGDNKRSFAETKIYMTALNTNVDRLYDKLNNISKDYLTKSEFTDKINKLETNTTGEILRMRASFERERHKQNNAIDSNAAAIRYVYGYLKLDGSTSYSPHTSR